MADDIYERIQAIEPKVRGANNAFRTDEPGDLEEFHAFYEPEEQAKVIDRARRAVADVLSIFERVKSDADALRHFLRTLAQPTRHLSVNLAAADPSFDASQVDAALKAPAAAPNSAPRRGTNSAPDAAPHGAVRDQVIELWRFLARTPEDDALLQAVAAEATGLTRKRGLAEVSFGRTVVKCAAPRKSAASIPSSYAAIADVFSGVLWNGRAGPVGYLGVTTKGTFAEGGWEPAALEEGDNEAFLGALAKAQKQLCDVHCAFACGSNWILFDPTRTAVNGEPALGFVSHGDCRWVPLEALDGMDSAAVLLRLLAWTLAGKRGLLGGDVFI